MTIRRIWILPFVTFLFVPCSFFITYAIAVHLGHVDSIWPFISTTGTFPPESCIFGLFVNIGAMLTGLVVYLRHRQIVAFYGHLNQNSRRLWRISSFSMMWLGFVSAFGACIVGNFQATNVITVHIIGAMMAFCLGLVYGWAQTIFSFCMRPKMVGSVTTYLRVAILIVGTISFIAMNSVGGPSRIHPVTPSSPPSNSTSNSTVPTVSPTPHYLPCPYDIDGIHFSKNQPGYQKHLVATSCEWLMVFCFMLFILTFAIEFRHAEIIAPKLVIASAEWIPKTQYPIISSHSSDHQLQHQTEEQNRSRYGSPADYSN